MKICSYTPLPFWSDAKEELEVDAWHWARKNRKIFFVEEIVYIKLNIDIRPRKF